MGKTTNPTTNKQGKGNKAATNKAQAADKAQAQTTDSNINTTMLSLLLPSLPTLTEVNKALNATFAEVINGPFRLFDLFSAEFIGMKNKLAQNKEEQRALTFGLSGFQKELYAKLALSSQKISIAKLEKIILERDVNTVLQTSDLYQADRRVKYDADLVAGKKVNKKGETVPFHEFNKKAWSGAYFQKMIFLACEYPKKAK